MDDRDAVAGWRREVNDGWLAGDPSAEACGHSELTLGGIRVLLADPDPTSPVVVYLHGGGYALGSPEVALPITERLVSGGVAVVSVDYRLAPEHPCPAGIEDAVAVCLAVAAQYRNRSLVIGGDSAGANLALSAALQLRDLDAVGVAGLLLLSPHLDHRPDRTDPQDDGARPSDLDAASARWLRHAYRGRLDPNDPRLSPLAADLRGLPPILVQAGTIDTSLGHAVRLARRARMADVDVVLDIWDGLWHTWQYHRDLPEADRALAEAAGWVDGLSASRP